MVFTGGIDVAQHLRGARRDPGEGVRHRHGHHREEVLGRLVELAEALPRLVVVCAKKRDETAGRHKRAAGAEGGGGGG